MYKSKTTKNAMINAHIHVHANCNAKTMQISLK